MLTMHARPRTCGAIAWVLFALCCAPCAEAAEAKRVLIIHSFGRDFAPYDVVSSIFRTKVAEQSSEPITFIEANLDFRRAANDKGELAFVEYLRARFDDAPPDVVTTIGPPAARFYLRHRGELFADTPTVLGALEERITRQLPVSPRDTVVTNKVDIQGLIRGILQVLPDTKKIAVVVGASELEHFWLDQIKRDSTAFQNTLAFEWLNDLSLPQMRDRVSKLPPHSAILYGLLIVDAAGVPHERQNGLASLHAVANAPIFGLYEDELGRGVVGGPYTSQRILGEHLATATLRALQGLPPQRVTDVFQPPVYDWRELERWKIDTRRLPADSEIRFKPLSMWERERTAVIVTTTAFVLQAALISALLVQRARRRRAELEARGLAGRLVTVHEDERRRVARELHDDVTQRLVGLTIQVAKLEARAPPMPNGVATDSAHDGLVKLGRDVHALSYRLHPSVIEDLGLVEALRIECDRVAQQGSLHVNFDCDGVPTRFSVDTALCLFRVAQEALRNVERHARATSVEVSLAPKHGGIRLCVRDNGAGFDTSRTAARASLGLASMRERVRTLGGRLDVGSRPGGGTALSAWVPLMEAV